jgi:hypothetical protein
MNENLKAKIVGKLGILSDEHGRQLMDYIDFLQSKYNRSRRSPSPFQRLAENIEDALGAGTITEAAAKGGAQVADAAGRVMSGLAAAGKAVADELSGRSPTDESDEPPADSASVAEPDGPQADDASVDEPEWSPAGDDSVDEPDWSHSNDTSVDEQERRDRDA